MICADQCHIIWVRGHERESVFKKHPKLLKFERARAESASAELELIVGAGVSWKDYVTKSKTLRMMCRQIL